MQISKSRVQIAFYVFWLSNSLLVWSDAEIGSRILGVDGYSYTLACCCLVIFCLNDHLFDWMIIFVLWTNRCPGSPRGHRTENKERTLIGEAPNDTRRVLQYIRNVKRNRVGRHFLPIGCCMSSLLPRRMKLKFLAQVNKSNSSTVKWRHSMTYADHFG